MAAKPPAVAVTAVPLTPARRVASPAPPTVSGPAERATPSARTGDRTALYAALVDAHAAAVLRYLYGVVGSRPAAEDLAQETYLLAWTHRDALRDPASARSWLFAIAANAARRHLRRRGRFGWLPIEALQGTAERELEVEGRDPPALALERALGVLGEADRQLVLLVGLEGFTVGEAAEVLELSPEAAKKRWQRACVRVRAMMDGGERSAGADR